MRQNSAFGYLDTETRNRRNLTIRSEAEVASGRGMVTATMLLDLIKAFETARLALIWRAGARLGFPKALLRLTLRTCQLAQLPRLKEKAGPLGKVVGRPPGELPPNCECGEDEPESSPPPKAGASWVGMRHAV